MRLDEDEQNSKKKQHARIPKEVLILKKRIYHEMDAAFKKSGKTLKNFFDKIDVDQSNKVEFTEFQRMFAMMNVPVNN